MKNKILKITGAASVVLITFLLAAPYLFKGKITSLLKAQINKNLRAHVNFSDVDISWFRHFPKIALGLDDLQVTCVGEFDGDTLITAKQLDLGCGLASFISGESIKVYSITLNDPSLHALVHKDGHSNWDILKTDTFSKANLESSARPFTLEMQRYAIHNGHITYEDESKDILVEMANLEHEGRGNFTSNLFTLKTKTTADAISFNYHGAIPCRITAKTDINLAFRVDNKSHTYSFKTDQISLNDLKLHAEGFFQWINDSSFNMNMKFNAPSKEFKDILSMLPSIYQKDFASIKSSGQVTLNGFVKGKYDQKRVPAYQVNLAVKNGFFQYPDLPIPVGNINLILHINNPDGIADHTIVNIPHGHVEINNDTVDFHLLVKNLKTKPFIDAAFVGRLDLANVSKLIKLESPTSMSGVLNADIYAKGDVPDGEKQKKDQFHSSGNFDLRNFLYDSKTYPGGIKLNDLVMTFNSRNVLINALNGEYLSTHVNATGAFNNLFAYMLKNRPLDAWVHLKADELNLKDWMKTGKDSTTTTGRRERIAPFVVPNNINFTVNAEVDKLHYDNLDMQNLSGEMVISDQTVQFNNVKADGLDGTMIINGTYSTKGSTENPEIALTYDVKGLDVQKTFFAFNTVQKLMPVGKFISGKFNAQMSVEGRLGEDMTPDLQSLYGEGNILLIEGSLKDFGPLDKLSQSLEIAELKDIPLNDTKANFTFKSSKVIMAPFTVYGKHIEMEIGGTHGFDQSLDYNVNLKMPRSQLGNKGSVFVKNVVTQAADKGIPVILRDGVSINAKISGTINSPDVKTNMDEVVDNASTDLKNEVNDFVNAKIDSAKQQLHHPSTAANKQLYIRAAYKSKNHLKPKKISASARKKTAHPKSKRKQKSTGRNYVTSLKKEKSTANNTRK